MRPTYEDVMGVVDLLIEMVPFFPNSVAARCTICEEIFSFVSTKEQLEWFSGAYLRHYPKWEGLPTLRAMFNTRYAPADGIMPSVNVPGHSTEELEAKYQAAVLEDNTRRQEEFERQKQLATGDEFKAFPLPDVKRLN
jgi:hypothetical protein